MNINVARVIVCLCIFVLSPSVSFASIIYSQTPIIDSAQISDVDEDASVTSDQIAAEIFTLGSNDTVMSLTWRGVYHFQNTPPIADDFTINFYSSAGGLPDTLLQSFAIGNSLSRIDTGINLASWDIYEYQADIGAGINLSAGTNYWVSIFNNTTTLSDDSWSWSVKANGDFLHAQSFDLSTWQSSPLLTDAYFTLNNASIVPVPPAVWLFGSGLLGLIGIARRKKV